MWGTAGRPWETVAETGVMCLQAEDTEGWRRYQTSEEARKRSPSELPEGTSLPMSWFQASSLQTVREYISVV